MAMGSRFGGVTSGREAGVKILWAVDQCDFDVPEEEAKFGILPLCEAPE